MADKKEKLKIQKVKNALNDLEKTINKNKLEFANKLYQKLQIDYLDNDDMKKLINKLSEDTMSIYEMKYYEIIEEIKGYMKLDGQVDFHKAKKLYEKIKE